MFDASTACKHDSGGQHGSILVLALLVTLLILGVGLTAMWLSSSGSKVSGNITRRQEALYAAEAGIDRARAILASQLDWGPLLDGSLCTATQDHPQKGNVLCDPFASPSVPLEDMPVVESSSSTASQTQGLGNIRYTVFVRNDAVESAPADGGTGDGGVADGAAGPLIDRDGRVIIRAEGYGKDGLGFVALEAVIARNTRPAARGTYTQKGQNAAGSNASKASMR